MSEPLLYSIVVPEDGSKSLMAVAALEQIYDRIELSPQEWLDVLRFTVARIETAQNPNNEPRITEVSQ